ncbi:MAG TPA: glycosyltransferase [Nitrososphaeraceae archaeon]|jgi:UDP-N-acetylglucosamine--N-acetylmuramyl-(pentapeptide) pyrophosphoryl-undecaprenol N-acetylglucosamine transferase
MFFFISPIGLGHVARDVAIIDHLKSKNDNKVSFVTGSAAFTFLTSYGLKAFNLYEPPKFEIESGKLNHSFTWLIKYLLYYKKCKEIAKKIIGTNIEELIVSDEDFASISIAEEKNLKRILITDIINTSFTKGITSIIEKKMNKRLCQIIKKCDCVIIPDYGCDTENFRYVGPIVREILERRETLRKRFNFTKKTIVVSVGGTDAGKYLIEKVIDSFRRLKAKLDIDLIVVTGPSLQISPAEDFRLFGYVPNLNEYIYASDLIISLAGRSTMDESIVYNIPGIFIPLKNHYEQEEGAKRLGFEYKDILRLDKLIEEKLSSNSTRKNTASNGAKKAADIISSFI